MNLPVLGIPSFGIPAFGIPVFGIPDFGFPGFGISVLRRVQVKVFPTFAILVFRIPVFGIPTVGIPAFGTPTFGIVVEVGHPLIRHPLESPHNTKFFHCETLGAGGAQSNLMLVNRKNPYQWVPPKSQDFHSCYRTPRTPEGFVKGF